MDDEAFSLEQRVLCSDGACIGVIGPDGRCKLCGKAYEGSEPIPAAAAPSQDAPLAPAERSGEPVDEPRLDPEERICCPDDACIGIIGENGKCGTCGKMP